MRYRSNPGKSYTVRWPGDPEEGLGPISWTAEVHVIGGQPRVDLFRNGQVYAEGISWIEVPNIMAQRDGRRGRQLAARLPKIKARLVKNPPKKKRSSKKRTRAFQIQSVLLEIDYFTPTRARVWLQSNGHKFGNLEESDRFYHARQHDPGDYQHGTLHNIQLAKHVEAVVGIPIEGTPAYEAKGYNKRGPRQTRLPLKQKAPYKGYSEEMGF